MSNQKISIIFCGGCNPKIDRGKVARQLKEAFAVKEYEVLYNSFDADFVIYISGCHTNCAVKYNTSNLPAVVVAAMTVDAIRMNEVQLVNEIVMKVGIYFGKLEKYLSE